MPRIPSVEELPLVQLRPLPSVAVETSGGELARA
jgi:hypothetical protein